MGRITGGGEQLAELAFLGGPLRRLSSIGRGQVRAGPPLKLADLSLVRGR